MARLCQLNALSGLNMSVWPFLRAFCAAVGWIAGLGRPEDAEPPKAQSMVVRVVTRRAA
jgi:hypothetical protein